MHTIDTSIVITVPPQKVWDVLVDFGTYAEWNPFIRRAEGAAVAGGTLKLYIEPPGGKGMTHHPTVLVAQPARHLRWLGKVAVPGLLAARHDFILEPIDEGTRLRHREEFTGLLVPFLGRTLKRTEEGFAALNRALKDRAEGRV
ncbi:SRPBCC domain-containing protein [Sphaerisporangium flaviroseum]|uniref:SRPBCC domain-containing protein n=1 Tax=Sphaerisporangium flaviroseum TaxID=509199 RepID=A0ABP7IDC2_9ACTN